MGIHMTDPLAFRGTYADWKLIKTRGVIQVVMEVPLADADAAYNVLGGMPDSSREVWFAIAPLKQPIHQPEKEKNLSEKEPATPQPPSPPAAAKRMDWPRWRQEQERRGWRNMLPTEQSGIRCNDAVFAAFLLEEYGFDTNGPEQAAIVVRQLCKVESRKEFNADPLAKARWQGLDDQFQAWKAHENA